MNVQQGGRQYGPPAKMARLVRSGEKGCHFRRCRTEPREPPFGVVEEPIRHDPDDAVSGGGRDSELESWTKPPVSTLHQTLNFLAEDAPACACGIVKIARPVAGVRATDERR